MSKIKNFNDLVFKSHTTSKEARMLFDNGYEISVLCGSMYFSNGIDTYEVGIFKNGVLCYDMPITNALGYIAEDEVSDIMRQIQEISVLVNMKSQFIRDTEALARQMSERLPLTREGGIIIMATDNKDVATCIIATPSCRKTLVEHMLANEDIQNDVIEIINESDSK